MKYLTIVFMFSMSLIAAPTEIVTYIHELEAAARVENRAYSGVDALRGKQIFTSTHIGKQGKPIACTSCHTTNLSNPGQNTLTGKRIDPLSPRANAQRLVSAKEVKKWLRRNFVDVYGREGTAQEKGDVLAYIMTY